MMIHDDTKLAASKLLDRPNFFFVQTLQAFPFPWMMDINTMAAFLRRAGDEVD